MAEGKNAYTAPALEKGLDILELLARNGQPMGTRQCMCCLVADICNARRAATV